MGKTECTEQWKDRENFPTACRPVCAVRYSLHPRKDMHRSEYVYRQEIRSIHAKMVRLFLRGGINSDLVCLLGPLCFLMFSKFLACMLLLNMNKETVPFKIIRP